MTLLRCRVVSSLLALVVALVGAGCTSTAPMTQASVAPRSTPAPQYPVRDFFAKPERGYFRLSQDGATLGFMEPVTVEGGKRRMNIFVQKLDGSRLVGEPRLLTHETARDIGNYFFKGDRVLYVKDFGGDENFHVVAVDIATGAVTDLTPGDKVRAGIVDSLPEDPAHLIVQHNRRDARVFDVYRVDLATGQEALIARNPGDIIGWGTDHDGHLRIAYRSQGLQSSILYRDSESEEFRPIITTDYKTEAAPVAFDAENRNLYLLSNRGRDRKALVMIDPKHPDEEQLVFADPEYDVGGAAWSRARKRMMLVAYASDKIAIKFFDPYMERVFASLRAQLPGMEFNIQSENKAEDKYVVAAYNDRTPGARYLYDVASDSLTKLGEINPKIPAADMAPMTPVQYRSRDGLAIHGYLTLPVGRPAQGLACIVNVHGGPWARDAWTYNPEVQLLANRGYCVLQVNYRSSTGYGRQFWEAGFGQWGLKMQDDVTDGVQWLISQGIADPKRVGIYGGSYGGYATLAGVAFTPDLYAAAVDYVGVSNLFTFLNTIPPYWKPLLPKFYEMVGHPERDAERLKATSPVMHADRIRTPLFIAQGARDPRVNKAESDQVVEALKARGVTVDYMVKDNEGHGFQNEENQFAFYEAMVAFFEKHMPAR